MYYFIKTIITRSVSLVKSTNNTKQSSFNPTDHEATVQLTGSYKAYLRGVTVARNLPTAEMALGRKVAVIFFDEYKPKEAVVIAVYS